MSLSLLYVTFLTLITPLSAHEAIAVQETPVTIGVLIPDAGCQGIVRGAELAVKDGMSGSEEAVVKLAVRSTEGPWGAGSKQSVSLVYDDEVRAYVGALDGRNAHLAEQVAAKSHLAYLETRATDPTLTQAYVPWFMRMVPSDDQQAIAIFELIGEEGAAKVCLLNEENYDTKYAVKSLMNVAAREYGSSPLLVDVDAARANIESVRDQILRSGNGHLIVPFCSEASLQIITDLRDLRPDLQIYGTLAFSYGLERLARDSWPDKIKPENLQILEGMILVHSYRGSNPQAPIYPWELPASYTYDAVLLILNAIHATGRDRQAISDYILTREFSGGKTGPCRFDELGNRIGDLHFIQIRQGQVKNLN